MAEKRGIVAGKLKDRGTVIAVAFFLLSNCGTYLEGLYGNE